MGFSVTFPCLHIAWINQFSLQCYTDSSQFLETTILVSGQPFKFVLWQIMWSMAFWVWTCSCKGIYVLFIHFAANGRIRCFFMVNKAPLCIKSTFSLSIDLCVCMYLCNLYVYRWTCVGRWVHVCICGDQRSILDVFQNHLYLNFFR